MAKLSPGSALLAFLFAPSAMQSLLSMYPPSSSGIARKAYGESPNLVPPPSELVGQRQKGLITDQNFVNLMMQAGYAPKLAENMLGNARTYLATLDYITSWRRGDLQETELNELLKEQGINDRDIATLKSVTIYYPTPQDLIRFAVRDVYTSQTIEQYGLFEDYPDKLDETAVKAGLTPEIAKLYWGSHWELPSPTEVFQMFHKKILTNEQVTTFLKVADYMPFWRDKLIKLNYNNITRVDIRRLYASGFLSKEQVQERYEFDGYSPDDAALLTEWTVADVHTGEDKTASSVIVQSYKAGTIDRATALDQLTKAKVAIDLANTLLDNADASIKQELIDLESDSIVDQYQRGEIDLSELQTQLTKLGVPARMMQLTIQRELAQARKRTKTSTKSELESWWRSGVIGDKEFRVRMKYLGYNDKDITLYLSELELNEISGADKKYPWAEAMRDFADGNILADGLRSQLGAVIKDTQTIDKIIAIAQVSLS